MSWELMHEDACGCKHYTDDWNRHKEDICDSCKKEKELKKYNSRLKIARERNKCFHCVLRDEGGKGYFFHGVCDEHMKEIKSIVMDKLKISNLKLEDAVLSPYIRKMYDNEIPKNRGYDTESFKKWVENLIRKEERYAESSVLENQTFIEPNK